MESGNSEALLTVEVPPLCGFEVTGLETEATSSGAGFIFRILDI